MRIAIVDVSSILHTVKHAIGKKNKLSHNERYTFVIFGFLFRLRSIALNSLADQIVFAYDSQSSIRRDLYFKEYKMKRTKAEKTEEQKQLDAISFPQFKIVQDEIIPGLGFKNCFKAEGYEADDIIARLCQRYSEHEICIVTSDEDMYQLLSRNISIMKPREYKWYTKTTFQHEYGIEPEDWRKVKVYGGCKSDEVPGLPMPIGPGGKQRHVGEGTAISYILNKLNPDTATYRSFVGKKAEKIINRNKYLTILPLRGTPEFTIVPDNNLSKGALIAMCKKFGFNSILNDIQDFAKTLKLR